MGLMISPVSFSGTTVMTKRPTTPVELAQRIDDTRLVIQPEAQARATIEALCASSKRLQMKAVCVRPEWVSLAKTLLADTGVKVATVIGFPKQKSPLAEQRQKPTIGQVSLSTKQAEITQAVADGADELDVVMDVSAFKAAYQSDKATTWDEPAHLKPASAGKPIKWIMEVDLLSPDEIKTATTRCAQLGVATVKTSTGFVEGGSGATPEVIRLMKQTLDDLAPTLPAVPTIKASGGVRTLAQAFAVLDAGADIIGAGAGEGLVNEMIAQQTGSTSASSSATAATGGY